MKRSGDRESFQVRARAASSYTWEFRNPQTGKDTAARFYLVPQQSRIFVIVAAGEAQRIYNRDAQMRETAGTMELAAAAMATRPPAPKQPAVAAAPAAGGPLADDTPAAQQWLQKLRGKVIKQFIGGGGMTGEKTRYLAPDGTYSMRGNSVVAIDVGPYGGAPTASASSISKQSVTGRWKIRDVNGQIFLQITTNDGNTSMLRITRDNRYWYLNGDKAFAVDP
jgi:hypothetical protein